MAPRPKPDPDRLAEDGLPPLSRVIAAHGLSAKKSLGQNFLLDLNLTRRIARAAAPFDQPGADQVVEIGPGPGGLTRALLIEGAPKLLAIERDERCLAALADVSDRWPERLTVLHGDAQHIALPAAFGGGRGQVVANLPYNVGTELLIGWLRGGPDDTGAWPPWWTRLTLMFQREVAERIVAQPGSKAYGRLSLLAQWRARAEIVFDVSAKAFTPPPKVTSAIVQLTPLDQPRFPAELPYLERVTAAAFQQRRKMLRASLKPITPDPLALLSAADVDETLRADAATLQQYCALARVLAQQSPPEKAPPETG